MSFVLKDTLLFQKENGKMTDLITSAVWFVSLCSFFLFIYRLCDPAPVCFPSSAPSCTPVYCQVFSITLLLSHLHILGPNDFVSLCENSYGK